MYGADNPDTVYNFKTLLIYSINQTWPLKEQEAKMVIRIITSDNETRTLKNVFLQAQDKLITTGNLKDKLVAAGNKKCII